jgi:hypothetical protein
MTYPTVPQGYRRLAADEVWTDGTDVIVLGLPPNADVEENGHNCDEMGCGQCHVLLKAEDVQVGFDFSALKVKP